MKKLSLYYYDTCGFCQRVLRAIERLELQVERRHVFNDPKNLSELRDARGKQTVPVLRIDEGDKTTWLPESLDIIAYLESLSSQS